MLRLIGGKSGENDHPQDADHEVEHSAGHEKVDHHRYDQSDQCHHQELAELGQVRFRRIPDDRHNTESDSGHPERLNDRSGGVSDEDRPKAHAHTSTEGNEKEHEGAYGELLHPEVHREHKADRGEGHDPAEPGHSSSSLGAIKEVLGHIGLAEQVG